MATSEQNPLRYANESGFPFQIAVQHAVEHSAQQTGWNLRYVEHGWVHPEGLGKGFIDLVLHAHNGRQFLVLECKRRLESDWVFMHSSGKASSRRHATLWITDATDDQVGMHGWAHGHIDPSCPEANFCAVRGQAVAEREALVERIGAELVLATEALARAERDFRLPKVRYLRSYIPVVVTTARLNVADFDPATVSLNDGKLSAASIRAVPWLRFRKQLATRFRALSEKDMVEAGDPSYSMENSIFIVHAASIIEFLSETELHPSTA